MTGIGGACPAAAQPLLALEAVSKSFGAVHALREASVALYPGEVHGLVGDEDAGKSELVHILGGVDEPDNGQLLIGGTPTVLRGPAAARAACVSMIRQRPQMLPDLGVAENVFMGRQPAGAGRRIDRAEMRRRADSIFARLGVGLDPARLARELSLADRQIVDVARAVSWDARVFLMDELTTVLSGAEADRLLGVIRVLRADGGAVLFVSHRLEEIFAACQRVTVMRDGRLVRTAVIDDVTVDQVIHLMAGRKLDAMSAAAVAAPAEVVLEVEALAREGVFSDVSFRVRRGEIVALAGLVGSGGSDVARALSGIDRRDAGRVTVHGRELPDGSPQAALDAGVAFVPEGRQQDPATDPGNGHNVAVAPLRRLASNGLIRRARERVPATPRAGLLRLKYGRMSNLAWRLPGGDQQAVVLREWLARHPSVLIIDEPTRGVGPGTKAEVHRLLDELALDGAAILMVSSELPEAAGMADRVLVLREGTLMAELPYGEANEASIMSAATGQTV